MNAARQPFLLSCDAILSMESRNPNYKEYVAKKVSTNRFLHHIGFQITQLEPGYMEGEVAFVEFLQQQDGFVHGGVTSTIADMVMGFAAYSLVEEGQKVMTVEMKVSYFNRGMGEKVIGKGRVLKAGKRFHFCEAEVYCEADGVQTLMAKASSTMGVIDLNK
jgi:uncharacterized protein (TIGR00369 family)